MNAKNFIQSSTFNTLMSSIIDLENSNLPIDYFTSVLPRAQYGDESAVPIGLNNADATLIVNDSSVDASKLAGTQGAPIVAVAAPNTGAPISFTNIKFNVTRSEERRVGKECRL